MDSNTVEGNIPRITSTRSGASEGCISASCGSSRPVPGAKMLAASSPMRMMGITIIDSNCRNSVPNGSMNVIGSPTIRRRRIPNTKAAAIR